MKQHYLILFVIFLVSCNHPYTNNHTILQAEALLNASPDSAYRLLSSIPHPEKLPAADYAAWCLQFTHAGYKSYQDIKSDSIIRIAVNYYDKSNLPAYSGTAYYLWGCILRLQHKNNEAMGAFKFADDILATTNNANLKGLVDFNIGTIYIEDDLYDQALVYYRKSLAWFKLSNNKRYQAYDYRGISIIYTKLNYTFKTIRYYTDLAIKLSKEAGDTTNYYDNLSYLGELLYYRDYAFSKSLLLRAYNFFPSRRGEYATFLAFTYSHLNRTDSANYYLRISFADTVFDSPKLLKSLSAAYVAKAGGNQNQAFQYLENAYNIRESVFNTKIHSQLYQIDRQFDLTKKENENAALKIANRNEIILITFLVIAVLFILIILLLINSRYKKKQIENELEKQRMEFDLKTKQMENERKRELLASKFQHKIGNTLHFNRLKKGFMQNEKQETFIHEITKQSVLAENEWQHFIDEVNNLFEGRIYRLQEKYHELTLTDLIVITLISLKVNIPDACDLLDMTKNTLYARRKTIKKRMGLDTEMELEEWINNYMTKELE